MMAIYDPTANYPSPNRPWQRGYFDGCFGNRITPGLSSWVVPGTWPDWCL